MDEEMTEKRDEKRGGDGERHAKSGRGIWLRTLTVFLHCPRVLALKHK